MSQNSTVEAEGRSGRKYTYTVYSITTSWRDVAGNYMFAKRNPASGGWTVLYIGETESFLNRLGNLNSHEKWPCARRNGVTNIFARSNGKGQAARRDEEADLIANYDPVCNG